MNATSTEPHVLPLPGAVAVEMAVYLITALPGIDAGPHVYALGQASVAACERWGWLDLTTIAIGIERKLGNHVAVAMLEHARKVVSR